MSSASHLSRAIQMSTAGHGRILQKSLRNSVLNSWLKSVQSLTSSYKTPSRVISTPWNPKISSFWMVSPFPRVSFLVPAVSFQEYSWDQQIHRNSLLPKWQVCEESQSGRPILISKAKGERQNSWTVEIYKKKTCSHEIPGDTKNTRGVKSLNFKQKKLHRLSIGVWIYRPTKKILDSQPI